MTQAQQQWHERKPCLIVLVPDAAPVVGDLPRQKSSFAPIAVNQYLDKSLANRAVENDAPRVSLARASHCGQEGDRQEFLIHVSHPGHVDIGYTVTRRHSIKELVDALAAQALEREDLEKDPILYRAFLLGSLLVIFVLSWLLPSAVLSASFSKVAVGDQVVVLLPIPSGFVDSRDYASGLLRTLEKDTPEQFKRLATFVTAEDAVRVASKQWAEFDRRMRVETPIKYLNVKIDHDEFRDANIELRKNWIRLLQSAQAMQNLSLKLKTEALEKDIAARLPLMRLGQIEHLDFIRDDSYSLATISLSRIDWGSSRKTSYIVHSTAIVLVKGRSLFAYLYSAYAGAGDVTWIRMTTAKWIDDILMAN